MKDAAPSPAASCFVSLRPQNSALPRRASSPSIMARTPSARLLDGAGDRDCVRAPSSANAAASGWWLESASRAPRFEQVGVDLGASLDARLGQRQRAGLVEDDRVDLGKPLEGVAPVEDARPSGTARRRPPPAPLGRRARARKGR